MVGTKDVAIIDFKYRPILIIFELKWADIKIIKKFKYIF